MHPVRLQPAQGLVAVAHVHCDRDGGGHDLQVNVLVLLRGAVHVERRDDHADAAAVAHGRRALRRLRDHREQLERALGLLARAVAEVGIEPRDGHLWHPRGDHGRNGARVVC